MDFPAGQPVHRDRYPLIEDPYNSARQVADLNASPVTIDLELAFVADASSIPANDARRSVVETSKSLYLTNPAADVKVGDRIRVGADTYTVEARPSADVNPFTGWQPVAEHPLRLVEG